MDSIRGTIDTTISNRKFTGKLLDEVNDARLLATATKRMEHFNPSLLITQEQLDQEFGFSEADYINTDEVEFE